MTNSNQNQILPINQKEKTMRNLLTILSALTLCALPACGHDDDDHDHDHENEVITSVILSFTPTAGGSATVFEVDDPDGDGGAAPTIDDIVLPPGSYNLAVSFENRLATPIEDITEEIQDESDEHQIFFTGTAVNGPASDNVGAPIGQAYGDMDGDGKPIGLLNTVEVIAGTGNLTVTLRHLPPINDAVAKVSGLAGQVQTGGFSGIGGSTDVQVTFPVDVQ